MNKKSNSSSQLKFLDNYTIDRKTINSDQTILKDNKTNNYVLMKQVVISSKQQFKRMVQTLEGQKQLQSQFLLKLLNFQTQGYVDYQGKCFNKLITFHQYSSHSLKDEIDARNQQQRYFSQEQIWSILCSVVYGLAYLQKVNIGHGCVSTNDIYLNEDGTVKLADPSIATSSPFIMTQGYYYSPQILSYFRQEMEQSDIDIFKSDVFSLGMSMLQICLLFTCEDCFDYQQIDIISQSLKDKFNSLIGSYSKELLDLLYQMLTFDCQQRPNFIELEKYLKQLGNQILTESQRYLIQMSQYNNIYQFKSDLQDIGNNIDGIPQQCEDIQRIDNQSMNQTLRINNDLIFEGCAGEIADALNPDLDNYEIRQSGSFKTPCSYIDRLDSQSSFGVSIKQQENSSMKNSSSSIIKQINSTSMKQSSKSLKSNKSSRDIKRSITGQMEKSQEKENLNLENNQFQGFQRKQNVNSNVMNFNAIQSKCEIIPNLTFKQNYLSNDYLNNNKRTTDSQLYTDPQLLKMMKLDVEKILNKRSQSLFSNSYHHN